MDAKEFAEVAKALSEPARLLIERTSNAIGAIYRPRQIVKDAEAEAEAMVIKARTEIEVRTMRRMFEEEVRRQENMETIRDNAIPLLADTANPLAVDSDWMANFFEKCRMVSDEEMQGLWARVLAGEANMPGTYSKRTINFMAAMDKRDAEAFSLLCSFSFGEKNDLPIIIEETADIYESNGLNYSTLVHLESIGLVKYDSMAEDVVYNVESIVMEYFERKLVLQLAENQVGAGKVILTQMGMELAPISGAKPIEGFFEYVLVQWEEYAPTVL